MLKPKEATARVLELMWGADPEASCALGVRRRLNSTLWLTTNENKRRIFEMVTGFPVGSEPVPVRKVAEQFGISDTRIRQIMKLTIRRLTYHSRSIRGESWYTLPAFGADCEVIGKKLL